jgi:hypothetical protein
MSWRRVWQRIQSISKCGLFKFFRNQILTLEESDIISLSEDFDLEVKRIKDSRYRLGWYMRGSFNYHDLMYKISYDDLEILNNIIRDNIEATEKTRMPLI